MPGAGDSATLNSGNHQVVLTDTRSVGSLFVTSGYLGGRGVLNAGAASFAGGVLGRADSTEGTLNVSGASTFAGTGVTTFAGTGVTSLNYGQVLNLNGNAIWTAGNGRIEVRQAYGGNSSTDPFRVSQINIAAGSIFTDAAAAAAAGVKHVGYSGGQVNNAATYVRNGLGTTLASYGFSNTGTVQVNAGRLAEDDRARNDGVIDIASGAVLKGTDFNFTNHGALRGTGTVETVNISNALSNLGHLQPGSVGGGTLAVIGDLLLGPGGSLDIDLVGLGLNDRLAISSDLSAGGTLAVWASGYAPSLGDSFVIATFDSLAAGSHFSQVRWNGGLAGAVFDVQYNAHDITLRVAAVPEPQTWLMLLGGLAGLLALGRRRAAPSATRLTLQGSGLLHGPVDRIALQEAAAKQHRRAWGGLADPVSGLPHQADGLGGVCGGQRLAGQPPQRGRIDTRRWTVAGAQRQQVLRGLRRFRCRPGGQQLVDAQPAGVDGGQDVLLRQCVGLDQRQLRGAVGRWRAHRSLHGQRLAQNAAPVAAPVAAHGQQGLALIDQGLRPWRQLGRVEVPGQPQAGDQACRAHHLGHVVRHGRQQALGQVDTPQPGMAHRQVMLAVGGPDGHAGGAQFSGQGFGARQVAVEPSQVTPVAGQVHLVEQQADAIDTGAPAECHAAFGAGIAVRQPAQVHQRYGLVAARIGCGQPTPLRLGLVDHLVIGGQRLAAQVGVLQQQCTVRQPVQALLGRQLLQAWRQLGHQRQGLGQAVQPHQSLGGTLRGQQGGVGVAAVVRQGQGLTGAVQCLLGQLLLHQHMGLQLQPAGPLAILGRQG